MKMKNRYIRIFTLLMVVLLAGIYIGYYVTAVRYEYLRAFGAGNEALIELDLLNNNLTEKVAELNKGKLVASLTVIDNLPDWAKTFNPSSKDSPKPENKMESYYEMIESLDGHFAMKVFRLNQKDLKRILGAHFGHYQVLKASRNFVDYINKKLRDSDNAVNEFSEPDSGGNG